MPDTLTLLGHTTAGNLIFETHDNTQYVCEQPVPGTAVWKNQNGNLHRAGKLSTVGPEFVLDRTACKYCGLQSNCHVCRSTDAAFETDFQTAGASAWSKVKGLGAIVKAKVFGDDRTRLIKKINEMFKGADNYEDIQKLGTPDGTLSAQHWNTALHAQAVSHLPQIVPSQVPSEQAEQPP